MSVLQAPSAHPHGLRCLCAVSLVGTVISGARPKEVMTPSSEQRHEAQAVMS